MRPIAVPAAALAAFLGLAQPAGNPKAPGSQEAAVVLDDRAASRTFPSSTQTPTDTPPARVPKPPGESAARGPKLSVQEYEGWRQYHVHCARCHGQDVLPNPVAANLLVSVGPAGPINSEQTFTAVVIAGRLATGMPAFKDLLSPDQIKAIYAYVKGRAEKRIPPGRPEQPA